MEPKITASRKCIPPTAAVAQPNHAKGERGGEGSVESHRACIASVEWQHVWQTEDRPALEMK